MIDFIAHTFAFLIDSINIMAFLMILWIGLVLAWKSI